MEVSGKQPLRQLHAAIKAACKRLLEGWEALPDEAIEVSFITGGISNALFKVGPARAAGDEEPSPPPVVFRIYGDNTEAFIDREHEMANMRLLHNHGFGPQVGAGGTRGAGGGGGGEGRWQGG